MVKNTVDYSKAFIRQTRQPCPACGANPGELCISDATWIHSLRFALNPGSAGLALLARGRGRTI